MIAGAHSVLWVRQDGVGNDACRFADAEGGYLIDGSATDSDWTVRRYRIRARDDGTTRRARIGVQSRLFVQRAPDDTWRLNGQPAPEVTGAKDIHLAFTPATLTLPIRRLKLAEGDEAEILVAELDVENERLSPRHLKLRRTGKDSYECVETETGLVSNLTIDRHGIVRKWDGRWQAQR
ncbi:putative glycolipid-binding domain-containing protein [Roseovarius aestuariivivens]|uniref:putative glycolipid-binding domain-containing protein n=1 Tax=Roseovarius aestuariivivens TaxID=1888910 RepID=UPI0014369586|nr:putative glycolipid-binding domain-containing protein [Roseovarius aestuariivivens]